MQYLLVPLLTRNETLLMLIQDVYQKSKHAIVARGFMKP